MADEVKKFEMGPNQKKWLEALKSGKYKHGKRKLKIVDNGVARHCCLGVGCEELNVPQRATRAIPGVCEFGAAGNYGVAPDELIGLLELRSGSGSFIGRRGSLVGTNDADETTDYSPIIKIIEETPERVFLRPA